MGFFNLKKVRKQDDQFLFRNEVIAALKAESITHDDEFVDAIIKEIFPVKVRFMRCDKKTARCLDCIIWVGDGNPTCPECRQSLRPIEDDNFRMNKELRATVMAAANKRLASVHLSKREFKEAILFYTRAILYDPTDGDSYYNRGEAKIHQGDFIGAIGDCDLAIKIDPKDKDAFLNRGTAKANLGDFHGAQKDTQTAINLGLLKPVAYFNLGLCLIRLNKQNEAKNAFEKVIEIDGKSRYAEDSRMLLRRLYGSSI